MVSLPEGRMAGDLVKCTGGAGRSSQGSPVGAAGRRMRPATFATARRGASYMIFCSLSARESLPLGVRFGFRPKWQAARVLGSFEFGLGTLGRAAASKCWWFVVSERTPGTFRSGERLKVSRQRPLSVVAGKKSRNFRSGASNCHSPWQNEAAGGDRRHLAIGGR